MVQLSVAFVIIGGTVRLVAPAVTAFIVSSLPLLPPGTQLTATRLTTNTGEVMVIVGIVTGIIWIVVLGAMHYAPKQLGEKA